MEDFFTKKKKVLWKILTQTRLKDLSPSKISQMVKSVEHLLKKKKDGSSKWDGYITMNKTLFGHS